MLHNDDLTDEQRRKLEVLARMMGINPEELRKQEEEARKEIAHFRELAALEKEAKSHRPSEDEPFEMGGAVSVRHIKEICSYLPDSACIEMTHPALVFFFNELHKKAREQIIVQATQVINNENDWEV